MRARHAVLAAMIVVACGGKSTPPAALGNASGPAPPRPGHGITVGAIDSTGGGREGAIKATAEQHVGALAHGRDVDALAIEVTLMSLDVGAEIACHVGIVVTTANDRSMIASLESSGKVVPGADPAIAIGDCIDALVGTLIDGKLAELVDARIAERRAR